MLTAGGSRIDWLAMAVATLWVVRVGGEVDADLPASSLEPLPAPLHRTSLRSQPRLLSCFRLGLLTILAALLNHQPLPLGSFHINHDYFY